MSDNNFKELILQGIPEELPAYKPFDKNINHAPIRKDILSDEEKKLALQNALRYFKEKHHPILIKEFAEELKNYGRIYMYRFRPDYKIYARNINEYPYKSIQAAGIMMMIQNNLDEAVAQRPKREQRSGNAVGRYQGADPADRTHQGHPSHTGP